MAEDAGPPLLHLLSAIGRGKGDSRPRTFAPFAHLVPMNAPAVLSNGAAVYDFQADKMLSPTQ